MEKSRERIYYDLEYVKKEELDILIRFDKVCKKHNLKYSLAAGTLLGAVRHRGFIPWDDDIDVLMPRKEFDRFCDIFKEEFDETYFLQTFLTDAQYLNSFAKIINLNIPAHIAETESLDIKKGICIDIFPIDKVAESCLKRIQSLICMSFCSMLKYSLLVRENENYVTAILHRCMSFIVKKVGVKKINQWENRIRTKYNYSASQITYADSVKPPHKLTSDDLYPYYLFESYSEIWFEGRLFSAISDYQRYLTIMFGDYMSLPPEADRVPGHNFYHY